MAAMVKLAIHPGTTIRINDNLAAFHCAAVRRYSDFGLGHMVPRMSELSIDTDAWVTAHNQDGEVCAGARLRLPASADPSDWALGIAWTNHRPRLRRELDSMPRPAEFCTGFSTSPNMGRLVASVIPAVTRMLGAGGWFGAAHPHAVDIWTSSGGARVLGFPSSFYPSEDYETVLLRWDSQ
jgi:hypothetical protein